MTTKKTSKQGKMKWWVIVLIIIGVFIVIGIVDSILEPSDTTITPDTTDNEPPIYNACPELSHTDCNGTTKIVHNYEVVNNDCIEELEFEYNSFSCGYKVPCDPIECNNKSTTTCEGTTKINTIYSCDDKLGCISSNTIRDVNNTDCGYVKNNSGTYTYTMNNPFVIEDNLEITVEKIFFVKNIFESDNEYSYLRSEDGQVYVILDIALKNLSNNVQDIYFPSPELLDQNGYSYKYSYFEASTSLNNSISFSESILPNSIKRGKLLFKVPENVSFLKLVFNNTPYVYVVDLPVQNKEIWFSTTDKEKPAPVMKLRIKEISSDYYDYFNTGAIYSISFNITNDSNYPIDDTIMVKGQITNSEDKDIAIYFEKVITMYSDFEEEYVSISEDDLDPNYGYKVDMNLYVNNVLVDRTSKRFALSD